ncbi:MAG: indole-3-glycerol phosphate synthase TrpC [Desulfarculus sp.]|nr:MAG: indole-3-glycerol phosphate synthase TrpC [Desulfarculus sp.]
MPDVLRRILEHKRLEAAALAGRAAELRRLAEEAPPPRDFLAALRARPGRAVIAEIKRASPSAGRLAAEVDPASRAVRYQAGGAAALSVLTDGPFFQGSLTDLRQARAAVGLPVLRKDFIIASAQLYEARAAGADAVLLIAAALEPGQLRDLYQQARELGLAVLPEVHEEVELEPVLALGPALVGVNNRDLRSLQVDLNASLRLRPLIPASTTVVAESGISGPEQAARLRAGGLDAFLVGSHLMRAPDPAAALRALAEAD